MTGFSMLFPLLLMSIFILLVLVLFLVFAKTKSGSSFSFSTKNLFLLYCYFLIAVSLITTAVGAASLLKISFASAFGETFSYQHWNRFSVTCAEEMTINNSYTAKTQPLIEGQNPSLNEQIAACESSREEQKKSEEQRIREEKQDDLVGGIASFAVGLILLLLHIFILRTIRPKELLEEQQILERLFFTVNTVFYALGSIGSFTIGISVLSKYLITDAVLSTNRYGEITPPGQPISFFIVLFPIWVALLFLFLRAVKREQKS